MERSIRIRLGLAAPIFGFVYFYLLVLLIGCGSDPSSAASTTVAPTRGLRSSAEQWQDHRYTLPVATVFVAEMRDQIALFEEDSDENVGRGRECKQQVALGHARCGPKRQDKAQVKRVT